MKGSAIFAVALTALSVADGRSGGLRPGQARNLQTSTNYQEIYFSEMIAAGESVVILEAGPITFTASCKNVMYDYDFYFSSSSFSNTPSSYSTSSGSSSSTSSGSSGGRMLMTRSSSAAHYYPFSSGSTSRECYDPCGSHSSSGFSYSFNDDYMSDDYYYSYDYSDFSYNESIAALELTYTAMGADYLYGSPSYANYVNETVLVGSYEAGESRTQTVFAGRDGGYGDMSTLQSTSGYYVSINGESTIGIHKEWTEYLPGGTEAFPEGIECMMAGFITYVTPEN